jgi:hypothetical protein
MGSIKGMRRSINKRKGNAEELSGIDEKRIGNVIGMSGINENKRGNTRELEESNSRKNSSLKTLRESLRRAAVGRCTPVCSRPLRGGRFQLENLSNRRPKVYVFPPIDTSEQRERVIVSGRESHPGCNVRTLLVAGIRERKNGKRMTMNANRV